MNPPNLFYENKNNFYYQFLPYGLTMDSDHAYVPYNFQGI